MIKNRLKECNNLLGLNVCNNLQGEIDESDDFNHQMIKEKLNNKI